MQKPTLTTLEARAPWRVLDGFGRAVNAACHYAAPESVDELTATVAKAHDEGMSVAFRGAGRSYGDASLNGGGLIIDTQKLTRVHRWDPTAGVFECEPGITVEGLWRRTIEDGYWPAVVPGTMRPTLGGCLAMNIHGKNNFRAGPFGDHVQEIDLLTSRGDLLTCNREQNSDVFHGAIGGLGMLGAITRVKLKLKKVDSGFMRVDAHVARNLDAMFDCFEELIPKADYLVGWVDSFARGDSIGRGQIHAAYYLHEGEDPDPASSFHVERQGLPGTILGFPKSRLWEVMRYFVHDLGVGMVNFAKYWSSYLQDGASYMQSHVAFAFLLDYVPNWRLAYGPGGFVQYQVFIPKETARATMKALIDLGHRRGFPSYLSVFKRHRPDAFLLSHALDGWSMAMDFKVTRDNREALWKCFAEMTAMVLEAGGKFYFAKDAVITADDVSRAYGREKLDRFAALKQRLDPDATLKSDLARRALAL